MLSISQRNFQTNNDLFSWIQNLEKKQIFYQPLVLNSRAQSARKIYV